MLFDGVAVVVAILIAFSLDAWWDERVDQEQTESLIIALEAEWNHELEKIDDTLQGLDAYIPNLATRINASYKNFDALSAEQIESMFDTPDWGVYSPATGAVNAIVFGGLGDIEDVDLSIAIASWPGVLAELRPYEEWLESIAWARSQGNYARIIKSQGLLRIVETGRLDIDSDEQRRAFRRAILADDERVLLWNEGIRAAELYRTALIEVRDNLQEKLNLLRLRSDRQ